MTIPEPLNPKSAAIARAPNGVAGLRGDFDLSILPAACGASPAHPDAVAGTPAAPSAR